VLLVLPAGALASIKWKGDFETGNLSQWSALQRVANDRLLVVSDPARQGKYAVKVTVKKGDDPISASGNRNELVYFSDEAPNSEYFYKWSTMFDASFPKSNDWQLFAQWHHDGCCGSPPLEFSVRGEKLSLRVGGDGGRTVWSAPLQRAKWNDFVLHVRWSADPKVGFIELYYQGQLVVKKTYVSTQYEGDKNYMKLGLYRNESIAPTGIAYHDGMVMATSLSDVLPPPPPPAPEVAPVVAPAPTPAPAPEPIPELEVDEPITPPGGAEFSGDETPATIESTPVETQQEIFAGDGPENGTAQGEVALGCSTGAGPASWATLFVPLALYFAFRRRTVAVRA